MAVVRVYSFLWEHSCICADSVYAGWIYGRHFDPKFELAKPVLQMGCWGNLHLNR